MQAFFKDFSKISGTSTLRNTSASNFTMVKSRGDRCFVFSKDITIKDYLIEQNITLNLIYLKNEKLTKLLDITCGVFFRLNSYSIFKLCRHCFANVNKGRIAKQAVLNHYNTFQINNWNYYCKVNTFNYFFYSAVATILYNQIIELSFCDLFRFRKTIWTWVSKVVIVLSVSTSTVKQEVTIDGMFKMSLKQQQVLQCC